MFIRKLFVTLLSTGISFCALIPKAGIAQSITPARDGTGTVITTPDGQTYDITGGSLSTDGANLFHSFEQLGLDAGQVANFLSHPEVQNILGRVVGGDPSVVNGLIQVTGGNSNLYLMNPAGFIFGNGASLNVPADFTATTANQMSFGSGVFNALGQNDYSTLVGNPNSFNFTTSNPGSIINAGDLAVGEGQSISLIGGTVINTGTISTPEGNITIAAVPGENKVRISQEGSLLSLEVDLDTVNPQAVSSATLPELLTGGHDTGITASENAVELATGERIPTAPGTAIASGNLDVSGTEGGNVTVTGDRVALINTNIDASGTHSGGQILIGGDYKGQGSIPNAQRTYVNSDSTLNAQATHSGDGGQVIVWADEITSFQGHIDARGGENSGDGGFVEVSGKESLIFRGTVDTSAPNGEFGTLLLDPLNIDIIGDGSPADGDDEGNREDALGRDPNAETAEVLAGDSPEDGTFEIFVSELEGMSGDTNIILEATNNITVLDLPQEELVFAPGEGSITFRANADGEGTGGFSMEGTSDVIRAEGRNIEISGYSVLISNIDTSSSEDGGNITLTSSGGDIEVVGGLNANSTGSGTGGTIDLEVTDGLGEINISSSGVTISSTSESGDGGEINFSTAGGNITTLDVLTRANGSGQGGDINFNIAASDEGTGQIDTSSGTLDASSATGDGGEITLTTAEGNIDTADVNTFSGGEGNGGEITLTVEGGEGSIDTTNGTLDSTSVDGDGGEIQLSTNEGNISASDISSFSSEGGVGANITLEVADGTGSINTTTGTIDATSAVGDGENVDLRTFQGSISTADINTYTNDSDSVGGDIELEIEDIEGEIDTTEGTLTTGSTAADAGSVELITHDGNIQTGSIDTSAIETGNAGDIDIEAENTGNIDTTNGTLNATAVNGDAGDIDLTTEDGEIQTAELNASASEAGDGGTISLTVEGSPGLINATSGKIDTSSGSGDGGNVILETDGGNINTADVNTSSGGDGDGGQIRMDIAANPEVNGAIDTTGGTLDSSSEGGDGGQVRLTTAEGNIDTADVNTYSRGSGEGGNIRLEVEDGEGSIDTTDGTLDTTSAGGDGGRVTMDVEEGNIATADINTYSSSAGNNGGNVDLTVNGTEGEIDTSNGTITTGSTVADGGNVRLDTTETETNGNIQTATIDTSSLEDGDAGNIRIETGDVGEIDTSDGTLNATAEDGDGGRVVLTSNSGNIQTGDIETRTTGEGDGGNINLTTNDIPGIIDTSNATLDSSSEEGDAGNIRIETAGGDIDTADVNASANGDGDGGNVRFDIDENDERIGQIDTTAGSIDTTSARGEGGNIRFTTAEGNIDTADLSSSGAALGGNIRLEVEDGEGSIDTTAGILDSTSTEGDGGNVRLDTFDGSISTSTIRSYSESADNTGGNISLSVNGSTGAIDTTADEGELISGSTEASGGNVRLTTADTTTEGNINTGRIDTSSTADGDGGRIIITAGDVGDIDTTVGSLNASSQGGDGGEVELTTNEGNIDTDDINTSTTGEGEGGDITLTANDIPGIIDTSNATLDSSSENGNAGSINIETAGGDINTADINASASGDGDGGDITFDIAQNDERIGEIDTTAGTLDSSSTGGDGGDISLTTAEGNISTSSINSFSDTLEGFGGSISLTVEGGEGSIDTSTGTLTSGDSPATGGKVSLSTEEGNISADDILTNSTEAGDGGEVNIEINSGRGDVDLSSATVNTSSETANGGDVTITTADGNIDVSIINTSSNGAGIGGDITLRTNEPGQIDASNGDEPILNSSSAEGDGGKVELESGSATVANVDASGGATGGDIVFTSDSLEITEESQIESNGELQVRTFSLDYDIRIGDESEIDGSVLNFTIGEIERLAEGFSSIIIGQEDGTGIITIVDESQFQDPVIYLQETEEE